MPRATPPVPPAGSPGPPHRVLVVVDDPAVATAVTAALAGAGHTTAYATDGFTALELAADFHPHAVVLDPALPGIEALRLRRRLRRSGDGAALLLVPLTGPAGTAAEAAERAGAGPVGARESVARVAAALHGAGGATPAGGAPVLRVGELSADPGTGRAARAGRELALTSHEFALLAFLMRHPGRVFSREQLLRRVWGRDFGDLSTVAARVAGLRAEVDREPAAARLLTEVWGAGYRFDPGGGAVVGVPEGALVGEPVPMGGAPRDVRQYG
ncbi:PhoB family transcriptional regulator [Streptomyces noursei ZPM]|uniref:DNA-binding response regulator n=1 Tax=Streptomyces noursei TaxID=1971 RepID=A0A401QY38_STRNR|nr:response regulator transcription factor [Streptomyces noursei]AKA02962.1 PhoB family transcriptional regulator [Streptomyces noursei ZPM]EPY92388.1 hypothetical protein K530_53575 [Streptomyces noursei CCRC 11814]EXU89918.1 chemotaxis protein CheY [Streptomyces noursei PD-1]GCB90283.1 DNA-binding response regulator [Streptomyces noursei]